MRILLDTHVWIWFLSNPDRLGDHTKTILKKRQSHLFVSAISVWEVSIKVKIGKLTVDPDLELLDGDFSQLAFTVQHAKSTVQLPLIHKDPFDRALIAQARDEQMRLITSDASLLKYKEWADIVIATT